MNAPLLSMRNGAAKLGETFVLNGADLDVRAGELVALLGPNGAGKTTLVRTLLGLAPLTDGKALIGETPARSMAPRERARRVAYLPQARPMAWPISVYETVLLGRFTFGVAQGRVTDLDHAAVSRALDACGITPMAKRAITSLSGGETARVHVARALASEAPCLVADEPIGALDPLHQWRIMSAISDFTKAGGGALVILHDLAIAARFATRIVLMHEGRILADGAAQETLTKENLRAAYGVDAAIGALENAPAIALLGPSPA